MTKDQSPTQRAFKRLFKNKMAMFGMIWLIVISLMATFAGAISDITRHPPDIQILEHRTLPPMFFDYDEEQESRLKFTGDHAGSLSYVEENFTHNYEWYILGTDAEGRDLFVRLWYGARVSLTVALIGTLVAIVIGVLWGAIAGYVGGWLDEIMMRFVDILYALPYIFFVIIIMAIFDKSEEMMFICIGAISWLTMSRIVRGEVKSLKERDYVIASIALGGQKAHIITRHIIPNILGIVIVYATLMVPQIILTETFLSWLGLGIQPPEASWGNLLRDGSTATAIREFPWLVVFPGLTLSLTLLALNFLGDGLRDAFDPRQSR